jgi:hypothetical protein
VAAGKALGVVFYDFWESAHAELDRPAGAGSVVVPVMMPHAEHVQRKAYRPEDEDVKPLDVDAFEFGVRLSLMP